MRLLNQESVVDECRHAIGDEIELRESHEKGVVLGVAFYAPAYGGPCYYVRYRAGDGRQVECWWNETALAE